MARASSSDSQSDEETLPLLRFARDDPGSDLGGFIAQRTVALSTVPTFVDDQHVAASR